MEMLLTHCFNEHRYTIYLCRSYEIKAKPTVLYTSCWNRSHRKFCTKVAFLDEVFRDMAKDVVLQKSRARLSSEIRTQAANTEIGTIIVAILPHF
jgi:hypothetical protein